MRRGQAVGQVTRAQAWEVAYEYLRDAILSDELRPGDRIVEMAIAEKLGMSQGPVREALARLGEQGLVTTGGRRGRYVTDVPVATGRMIFELRARVEPLATRTALQHLTPADFDALAANVEGIRTARSVAARLDADMAFHRRIYQLADYAPLLSLWEQMELQTRRLRPLSTFELAYQVHLDILEAMRSGDEQRIDDAVSVHMRDTWSLRDQGAKTDPARG